MRVDLVKTLSTYGIALVVIIGGGVLLVIETNVDAEQLLPFLTGAIGTVLGYVFAERQTATTQSGNGLERNMLQAVHRRLDVADVRQAHADAGTMATDQVTVDADHVDVHERHPGG